ncbi:hypothetical protein RB595_005392 [Gaeumannomyces hyphopodioides]
MASTSSSAPADTAGVPQLLDLTIDNITPNTVRINSQAKDARLRYLMERLVTHLHDFARETRLSTAEWEAAIGFLIATGHISDERRNEFILLSDVLGLSLLVDNVNHPTPPGCTEGSVLGPFHTHEAPELPNGAVMTSDPEGEPMLAVCTVRDRSGAPLAGVKVDIWETDSSGHYDVQHAGREEPSERCVMRSDGAGRFWFRGLKPVSYPIPNDGPVGKLLERLGRHCWRPAHVHFMFEKAGFEKLITALYLRGDPYETSDAVFGVKKSLVVDLGRADAATAAEYGVAEGTWLLRHDFVLVTEDETSALRDENALEALRKLGLKVRLEDHLPVPDLD